MAENTLPVCPTAAWHFLPVVPNDPAPLGTFANVAHWETAEYSTYIKSRVLPHLYVYIVFFGITVLTIFVLSAWRLGRCCCSCMQAWCDEDPESGEAKGGGKGGARDATPAPADVLAVSPHWWLKIIMVVLALASFGLCAYGMAVVKGSLVVQGWDAIINATYVMDAVTAGLSDVITTLTTMVPALAAVSNVTQQHLQVAGFRTNSSILSPFLDSTAANVSGIYSGLNTLSVNLPPFAVQLSVASTDLSITLPALENACNTVASYGTSSYYTTMTTKLANLQTALANMPAAQPATNAATVTALSNALAAATVPAWATAVASTSLALTLFASYQSQNTLALVNTHLDALSAAARALLATGTSLGPLIVVSNNLPALAGNYTAAVALALTGIVAGTATVDSSVVALDTYTLQSVANLSTFGTMLTSLQQLSPSPAAFGVTLKALNVSVASLPGTTHLEADITSVASYLTAGGSTATFQSYVTALSTALAALVTPYTTTQADLTAWLAGSGSYASLYSAINTDSPNSLTTCTNAKTAAAASASITANIASWATTVSQVSTSMSNFVDTPAATLLTQAAATAIATAAVSALSLQTYIGVTQPMNIKYKAWGSVPSKGALGLLNATIEGITALTVTSVWSSQVAMSATVALYANSSTELQVATSDNLRSFRVAAQALSAKYWSMFYGMTMGTYGTVIMFLLLLIFFVFMNCSLGCLMSAGALLVCVALFFIIDVAAASLLTVSNDVCYNMEDVLYRVAGNQYWPLVDYYVFDSYANVSTPLKNAGVIDVAAVIASASGAANDIVASFSAQYSPRGSMASALSGVQVAAANTVNAINALLLHHASYTEVHPMYVSLKSYLCCTAASEAAGLWTSMTFAGWLILATCWLAAAFVARLDRLSSLSGEWGWRSLEPRFRWRQARISPNEGEHVALVSLVHQPSMTISDDSERGGHAYAAQPLYAPPPQFSPVVGSTYQAPAAAPGYQAAPASPFTPAQPKAELAYQAQVNAYNSSVAAYFNGGGAAPVAMPAPGPAPAPPGPDASSAADAPAARPLSPRPVSPRTSPKVSPRGPPPAREPPPPRSSASGGLGPGSTGTDKKKKARISSDSGAARLKSPPATREPAVRSSAPGEGPAPSQAPGTVRMGRGANV